MKTITTLVPVLTLGNAITNLDFYKNAFGAKELWRISNPDGSVHVAAFSIDEVIFRIHEQRPEGKKTNPATAGFTTVTIGLQVDDVHSVFAKAVAAGATVVSPVTDHEYGYRQGELKDPFGHIWIIEKILSEEALNIFLDKTKI
jgi:PhnB protein